jgi:[ribosomal protein S5]-alanine N-acetyltransferase
VALSAVAVQQNAFSLVGAPTLTSPILAHTERLQYSALAHTDVIGLYHALAEPLVYAHLGGDAVPSLAAYTAEMTTRIAGPLASETPEQWYNVVVRLKEPATRPIVGRLEATVYGAWAEIAYLFAPGHWGRGYATEAMRWWHAYLHAAGVSTVWAAVAPGNAASLRLLARLGYVERPPDAAPHLGSYDAGDRVFSVSLLSAMRAD